MAGYSGGRKVITPGVAHQETITRIHTAGFLEDPNAVNCVVEGNPLHEEQLEIVGMIGGALAVNTVIDDRRRLSFVNFGEIVASHAQAVSFMRTYAEIPFGKKFRTVITSSAGYPLDKTYYQTIKGMVGAINILEPGGDLFVVSECSEGMGSPEFVAAQRELVTLGDGGFMASIQDKSYALIDEWESEMQVKATRVGRVHLFAEGLKEEERPLTGVNLADSLDHFQQMIDKVGGQGPVAVIPEGPYVIPMFDPNASS